MTRLQRLGCSPLCFRPAPRLNISPNHSLKYPARFNGTTNVTGPFKGTDILQRGARIRVQPRAQVASSTGTSSFAPQGGQGPQTKAQSLDVLLQERKWPLIGAGFMALGIGLYVSIVITSSLKKDREEKQTLQTQKPVRTPCTCTSSLPSLQPTPSGLPAILQDPTISPAARHTSAISFDRGLDLPEWLTGIKKLRKAIGATVRGHVLEVAVGTGRNIAHYDWSEVVIPPGEDPAAREQRQQEKIRKLLDKHLLGRDDESLSSGELMSVREYKERGIGSLDGELLSFTGVDVSGGMLAVARDRVRENVPGLSKVMRRRRAEPMPELGPEHTESEVVVNALDNRIRLVLADALHDLPAPAARDERTGKVPEKYDTIVQTFGLCSVSDPSALLAKMAAKVQPDTGRIILLEHGRGWWDWVNGLLDKYAPSHFEKYGCWWNRDIEKLVRDAAEVVPGLEVVSLTRPLVFQAGTTLLIELKVSSQKARKAQ